MSSVQLPPGWFVAVRENPDGTAIVAPSGRMFHLARNRNDAVRVVRAVMDSLERSSPGSTPLLASAHPDINDAMRLFLDVALRSDDEEVRGGGYTQLIDVTLHGLTWADLGIAVACG